MYIVFRKSLENLVHENGTIENMENLKHIIKLLYQERSLINIELKQLLNID